MRNYVLSLDAGKHSTKATGRLISEDNTSFAEGDLFRVDFRTKMFELDGKHLDLEGNSHKVIFGEEAKEIILGEQGLQGSFETTKINDLHRLCAYTAITQYLIPGTKDNNIYLALACPIEVLKIAEVKEEYKKFIKGDGVIKINVDDKDYEFEIVDIIIKAEGSGTVYTHPEYFADKNTLVVDLGGLNMSVQAYFNKVMSGKDEDRFSEEFGGNKLTDHVRESLKVYRRGNDVKLDEVENALKNGYLYKLSEPDKKSIDFIVKGKERYISDIISIMERKGQRLENYQELVFLGGTTSRVEEQVRSIYKNARIPENPQWDSIDGLYKVAYARYVAKNKK